MKIRPKISGLPNKPSELLTLALDDLQACHRSKKYNINMNIWYNENGACTVCLAGAVIAKESKNIDKLMCFDGEIGPWCFNDATEMKLNLLDSARRDKRSNDSFGLYLTPSQLRKWEKSPYFLYYERPGNDWISYSKRNHQRWMRQMRLFARRLKAAGV